MKIFFIFFMFFGIPWVAYRCFVPTLNDIQAKVQRELSERAFNDFSMRHDCSRENTKEVFPEDLAPRCGNDTSGSRVWVIQGCRITDVYTVEWQDAPPPNFFFGSFSSFDRGVPTNSDVEMTNIPYVPLDIFF